MDLQTRKIEFIPEFLKIQSEEVISKLENFLRNESNDQLQAMTMEEFNSRIDQSMEDSKNGHLTKASDLKAKMDKWN